MAISAVVDFLEATRSDDSLRAELVKTLGVGDGDVSSAAELDEAETEALLGQAGVDVCALAERSVAGEQRGGAASHAALQRSVALSRHAAR